MLKPVVTFFHRKPYLSGNYSLEFIFSALRKKLVDEVDSHVSQCRFYSNGIFKRIFNAIEAFFKQKGVNFIAGDVHYISAFLKKRKTILLIADCGFLNEIYGIKKKLVKFIWLTMPVRRVSYVTTISEHAKQVILEHVKCAPDKVIVIPVGISSIFYYTPKAFNQSLPVLLQIGQAKNKNLTRIIEAIKDIPVRLSIIGKISAENEALLKYHSINFTHAYNLTEKEVVQKYIESDMLVFPSTYEGFGMPIIEAQAVGRPVVTSNVTSMPWVSGDAACLVDPFCIKSIRSGITQVIEDKTYRDTLIGKGLENVKRFDTDIISNMYLNLIKQVNLNG